MPSMMTSSLFLLPHSLECFCSDC